MEQHAHQVQNADETPAPETFTEDVLQKLIVVTGFGPFIGHETVNASWEAVRLLPDVLHFKDTTYTLEKQMIPVEYAAVDSAVQAIWTRKPELVIHCGVHGLIKCLHIEKLAYNHNFKRPDYAGKRLPRGSACLVKCRDGIENDVIRCSLDVNKIVEIVGLKCGCKPRTNSTSDAAVAKASNDVGNYLCGYIYLKSLDMNKQRSLFVHVPPINEPFSSADTAKMVLTIIEECVRQLVEDKNGTC